ncbi:hypothetical protein LTR56_002083 [Elasticomyces elasticus]|nr:hypothetical protein LTR22_012225 [Elasticomyces elasticus]KAK3658226.1 hypothetical protein LTR56_002083 [Elasticomyces elasticus]KAK4919505.1 hypothetical protein LTR49_012883 [Elasticomyces elasticus]KAK5764111.1 hypothetical protein LTS12_005805 [Elasticomyces elasticus]
MQSSSRLMGVEVRSVNQFFDQTTIFSLYADLYLLASHIDLSDQLLQVVEEAKVMTQQCREDRLGAETAVQDTPRAALATSSVASDSSGTPDRGVAGRMITKVKTTRSVKRQASSWPRPSRMTKEESLKQCLLEISPMPRSTMKLAGVGKIRVARRIPRSKLPRAKFAIQDAIAEEGEDEKDVQGEGQDTSALCVGFAALGV